MAGMMSSNKNRSVHGVDNPYDGDGFWLNRHFKRSRKAGAATGGRGWRRALRKKEKVETRRDIASDRD